MLLAVCRFCISLPQSGFNEVEHRNIDVALCNKRLTSSARASFGSNAIAKDAIGNSLIQAVELRVLPDYTLGILFVRRLSQPLL